MGSFASEGVHKKELTANDQEQSGKLIECSFTLSEQQGKAKTKGDLKDRRYTLVWRPTGSEDEEIVLFEDRSYEEAWNTGEKRSVAASMITARFRECSNLEFPAEGGEPEVDLPETLKKEYKPFGDDRAAMYPTPETDGSEPAKSRSSSGESSSGGGSSSGGSSGGGSSGGAVPGAKPPKTDPPPGDRWIAIYGAFAREMEDASVEPRLLGAYKATESGKYKRADLSGRAPSASGPAQSDVLLPTGHVGTGAVDLFVRLAMGTPSSERFRQGAELLKSSGMNREDLILSVTPLFYGQPPPGEPPVPRKTGPHPLNPEVSMRVHDPANHVGKAKDGPGSEVYLVNALWAAERRMQAAETARDAYQTWIEQTGWADGPSGMVGGLCYEETHDRTYLADRLDSPETELVSNQSEGQSFMKAGREVQAKKPYAMGRQWAPFSPDQIPLGELGNEDLDSTAAQDYLGQFRYGLRCKQAFLFWNRGRASNRARLLLDTSYFYHMVLDLYSASSPNETLVKRVRGLYTRLASVGGHPPLHDAEETVAGAQKKQNESSALAAVTGSPTTALVLKMAGKTAEAAHAFAMSAAPTILGLRTTSGGGLPEGARSIARMFMGASHADYSVAESADAVRFHKGSPDNAEVTLNKRTVGAKGNKRTYWQIELSGKVKTDFRAATATGSGSLRILNMLLAGASVYQSIQDGEVGFGDALAVAKFPSDAASLIDEGVKAAHGGKGIGAAGKFGSVSTKTLKTLMTAGPWLDGVLGAWQAGSALLDEDVRGQTKTHNPNPLGVLGAVVGTAGGLAMASANAPTFIIGGLGVGFGAALGGLAELEDRLDIEAADPLSDWLPAKSLWGEDFSARDGLQGREAFFKAVRPESPVSVNPSKGKLNGMPLKKALTDKMKAVTEQAFYFPTGVGVRTVKEGENEDPTPVGLQLDTAVGYLPSRGTLMVDATVNAPTFDAKPLQCIVHYVETEDGFRYCVKSKGGSLDMPIEGGSSFQDWLDREQWAWAPTDDVRLPNGEWTQAPRLQVHLGEWALQWHEKQKQTVATTALKLHRTHSRAGSSKPWVHSGRLETARRIEREVAPTAHQSGPEGLQSILESGQFQVSGTISFNPLQPFDPSPSQEQYKGGETPIAKEDIKFRYPRDVSN